MISIQSSLTDLERSHQLRTAVLDCYVSAIRNIADYAVEFDEKIVGPHRKHLNALATDVSAGAPDVLRESTGTLRALLREHRDKSGQYLGGLRDELASTARTLEEVLENLGQADSDHEVTLRSSLAKLRQVAMTPGGAALKVVINSAADSIEASLEQVKRQHQLTTSQFLVEIRMLHKRIDMLEAAASADEIARFASREELSELLRTTKAGQYCLLLISTRGLLRAEVSFGKSVASELGGAFAKRLRNSLPITAVLGRWSAEEFVVLLRCSKAETVASGKWISEHLSGTYTCLIEGKPVRPALQLSVGVVETTSQDAPERIIERIGAFLTGQPAG